MKTLFFSGFLLIGISLSAIAEESSSYPPAWQVINIEKMIGAGSGFFIAPNQFITNLHVIYNRPAVRIPLEQQLFNLLEPKLLKLRRKRRFLSVKRIVRVSTALDLALLETKETVSSYLDLREHPLEPKENIQVTGYPVNRFGIPIFRSVKKTREFILFPGGDIGFLTNSKPLNGASGSPLLDSQGKVSGVLYGGRANFAYATSGEGLKSFIAGKRGSECSKSLKACVEKDMELLRQSAKQGDILSQRRMGYLMYGYNKLQVIQYWLWFIAQHSPQKLQHWLQFIAQHSPQKLQHWIPQSMAEKPPPEFYLWMEKAAQNKDPRSQYMMGSINDPPLSVRMMGATNREERNQWLQRAAQQAGFFPAIHQLAMSLHEEGKIEEAKNLFEEAAKAGYMPSQTAQKQLEITGQLTTLKDKCLSIFRN